MFAQASSSAPKAGAAIATCQNWSECGQLQRAIAQGAQMTAKSSDEVNPSDFVTALARGLEVLACFKPRNASLTVSDVAEQTGLSRGTSRRFLLTLQSLHFLSSDGKYFRLTPKVLQFGNAYLATTGLAEAGRFVIPKLTERFGGSCSMAVLDEDDVVYISRVEARRIFSVAIEVGSRLPAYCSAVGRILLAGLSKDELDSWFAGKTFRALTPKTITKPAQLRAKIDEVRRLGYSLVDDELELGLRMIAVPIRNAAGRAIAGLTMGAATGQVSLETLRKSYVPMLLEAASEIERKLTLWDSR